MNSFPNHKREEGGKKGTPLNPSTQRQVDLCEVEASPVYKVSPGQPGLHTEKKKLQPDENLWGLGSGVSSLRSLW